jgi:peptidoglycan/LPS O-acetylase OafA/YrhL
MGLLLAASTAMSAGPRDDSKHILALTGLRGYAALWVVLSHASFTDALLYPLGMKLAWHRADGLIRHEYLAVDLFFMLSGFVLTHVHQRDFDAGVRKLEAWRFLLLRLARVYPLHLLALGMTALAWHFVPGSPTGDVSSFVLQLALMASWGFCAGNTWNLPAWSLSSEWLAYLVFPLVALATAGVRKALWQIVCVVALLGLFWLLFFGLPFRLDYSNGAGSNARVIIGVIVGSLLRRLYDAPVVKRIPWTAVLFVALPVMALSMTDLAGRRLDDNIWAVVSMPVLLFAAAHVHPKVWPLTGRLPVYLGEISYAIYILHYPVLRTIRWLAGDLLQRSAEGSEGQAQLVVFSCIGLVVLASAAAHHLVELPSRRWLRKRLDRSWPPAVSHG